MGGPNLYWQEFGHLRLRMRHFPFSIELKERDQWLVCMMRAVDDLGLARELRETLLRAFTQTANHMVNRAD